MGRRPRLLHEYGVYHIILRGNNKQNIFENNVDRKKMHKTLQRFAEEVDLDIYAWCFMNNHIHLLIKTHNNKMELFMKKVEVSYVAYFNKKYSRVGSLFQERYKSVPVETDESLLATVRYIHQNPQKAGMANAKDYEWSSYKEYIGKSCLCKNDFVKELLRGTSIEDYMAETSAEEFAACEERITDDEAYRMIEECMAPDSVFAIQGYSRERRNEKLRQMHQLKLKYSQISRVTGIPKSTVKRACEK